LRQVSVWRKPFCIHGKCEKAVNIAENAPMTTTITLIDRPRRGVAVSCGHQYKGELLA
jgi:hypothetical protein